ncbi:circularly permuted type 2 ATP-grasp protein [Rhodovulum sulfidophilum]|uniref:circularly permuted type 2 ATP-grasp protein n=1 Tax=Rhodovulum sulfidophilum TaxID=35806 RepID=UPI0019236C0B|nr:circularly permuted type 2 ATP-grasp protein [Rhodovulum sulfidophilum]MBL3573998.1 circularly permuted type 2 ATP-grasp protein [Rhodovulum sulfidophilum]MCE8431459.1 circularly permuted type 2 ATP-grasp protein [Rhodovulum sulfidophilum]MCF4116154.1 circularly permuted type 2 ATP-grasp protein [Rhodovulum sulfidophilum]
MTAPEDTAEDPVLALLQGYSPPNGVADELLRPDGSLRPVWRPLIELLARQSPEQMAERFARGDQYLHDAGVYYRQHTQNGSALRDWPLSHVPVVIDGAEWQGLVEGIVQRADLLERVMADLYGTGDLVANGLLPAELIARNPEWLRPVVGIRPPSGHFLHFLAFEVGRSPDGSWLVLGDRTQAPSGSGFALENRMATSRVFQDLFPAANIERLAGFFRAHRNAMTALKAGGEGKVAILTPGHHSDTYFEHAYIARYLGLLLLECEDLKLERGRLMVRTIHGPQPVSVLWRRLDSRFADPLELDENSALGTPGMLAALRAQDVTMLNCLGSGVLEARALMAFLPRICEKLMGVALKLPNIATWWCGQDWERSYVYENLHRMMIGRALSSDLPFEVDASTALGGDFRGTARRPIGEWLERDGPDLVGQEAVTLSTTPAMIDGRLLPRPALIRVFATRTPGGWVVMPGGYARIGRSGDPTALGMKNGGSVADVWVTSERPVEPETLTGPGEGPFLRRAPSLLPSRAADNLFWLGRYIERAEARVRELRAYHLRLSEGGDPDLPLVARLGAFIEGFGVDIGEPVPAAVLELFEAAQSCAGKVRDRFSTDGWHALTDLSFTARGHFSRVPPGDPAVRAMGELLRKLAGFSGLVHENMFRSSGWRFLTMGRALERADQMISLLTVFADPAQPAGGFDVAIEVGDSVMTHRRRYSVHTDRNTLIDLLGLDIGNPRSVLFQLDLLREQERMLARSAPGEPMSDLARAILLLHTELSAAVPEDIGPDRLYRFQQDVRDISTLLTQRYLS